MKVYILAQCEHCEGQAHLPAGQAEDYKGEKYTRHQPCSMCNGCGNQPKWVSLVELETLLKEAFPVCPHQKSYFTGGHHYNGQQYWDDITEWCSDCGVNLDRLPNE